MNRPSGARQEKDTILVVDDTAENLIVLGDLLQPHYRVRVANSGPRALKAATSDPIPDLILLDIMMPGMDGFEVLRQLKASAATRQIPVIFVTAMDATQDEEYGLNLGAVDYLAKPIKPAIVLARVRGHLELKHARDALADTNAYLEAEVQRRMHDNIVIQDASIRALAALAEARDIETGMHVLRTQAYVALLARQLATHPRFADFLTPTNLNLVIKAAPLHDIGKVGIADSILLKPGRLTPQEYELIKEHSAIGADAIDRAMHTEFSAADLPASISPVAESESALGFLRMASEIARYHHERWDGNGYPEGLAGDAIPISARVMALADVFDALTSMRVYKEAMPFDDAVTMIQEASGAHFDPDVVLAFQAKLAEFRHILDRYADSAETLDSKLRIIQKRGLG